MFLFNKVNCLTRKGHAAVSLTNLAQNDVGHVTTDQDDILLQKFDMATSRNHACVQM